MADGDVKYRFMADAAAAERAIAGLEKKYDQLEQKIKGVAKSSKKGNDDGVAGFQKLAASVGATLAGFATVDAAVQAGTALWRERNQVLKDVAQSELKLNRSAIANAFQGGRPGGAQRMANFARSMDGTLPAQAMASLEGVMGGAPLIGADEQERLARAVASMSPVLAPPDASGAVDTSKLREFGETAATLNQFFKNLPTGDLLDLSSSVMGSVGPANMAQLRSGKFEQAIGLLMDGGVPAERALATASVGMDAGLSAKELLRKGAMAGLDQEKISALEATFGDAMRKDIAGNALRDVVALNPAAMMAGPMDAASRAANGGWAADAAAIDVFQQQRHAAQSNIFGLAKSYGQAALEEIGFGGMQVAHAMGVPGTGPGMFSGAQQIDATAELQRQTALLQQIANQNKTPIRRDAQTE